MRVRLSYSELELIRFTGHLDLQRVWERTFRRSKLPVAYSKGFHPQARIQIACALPLGFTSLCELLDFWLDGAIPLAEIEKALTKAIPPGIRIDQFEEVDPSQPPLQTQVIASDYMVTLLDPIISQDLELRVNNLLSNSSLIRIRREKQYDLRPLVEDLVGHSKPDQRSQIFMRLSARENATARPEEVLSALGFDPFAARIERTHLILKSV